MRKCEHRSASDTSQWKAPGPNAGGKAGPIALTKNRTRTGKEAGTKTRGEIATKTETQPARGLQPAAARLGPWESSEWEGQPCDDPSYQRATFRTPIRVNLSSRRGYRTISLPALKLSEMTRSHLSISFLFHLRIVLIVLIICCSIPGNGPVVRPVRHKGTVVGCGGNAPNCRAPKFTRRMHATVGLRSLFYFGSTSSAHRKRFGNFYRVL
jgi:hypothetical protein